VCVCVSVGERGGVCRVQVNTEQVGLGSLAEAVEQLAVPGAHSTTAVPEQGRVETWQRPVTCS